MAKTFTDTAKKEPDTTTTRTPATSVNCDDYSLYNCAAR